MLMFSLLNKRGVKKLIKNLEEFFGKDAEIENYGSFYSVTVDEPDYMSIIYPNHPYFGSIIHIYKNSDWSVSLDMSLKLVETIY